MSMTSPLLNLPGAVGGDGIDAPVAAHYGSFNGEQRVLETGSGFVDLSHRDVIRVEGPDRLTWLHSLTTQFFEGLAPGVWTQSLILSPQGHVFGRGGETGVSAHRARSASRYPVPDDADADYRRGFRATAGGAPPTVRVGDRRER